MLFPRPILLAFATLLGLELLAGPASTSSQPVPARPGPASTSSQPVPARPAPAALNATLQAGETIGNEQHWRVFMNVEGRELMFVVPQGFRTVDPNPERVVLANHDYSCILSFRIAATGSVAAASLNADLCRGWLTARLGDLKIQEEFSLTAASQRGTAFDVYYKADGLSRSSRVAFIPSPVGVLEFSLVSSPEKFPAAKSEFHGLLRGFRISDANGKVEIRSAQSGS